MNPVKVQDTNKKKKKINAQKSFAILYTNNEPSGREFFFNDTATTEIYTLSLHDALPILGIQHVNLGGCD